MDLAFRRSVKFHLLGLLYRTLGRVFQKHGHSSFSLACFREAARLNPDDAQLSFSIGKALLLNDDVEAAAAAFKATLQLSPDFPEAHNNLGVTFEMQGLFSEAEDCYRTALDLKPNYAAAYNNLGNIHLSQSRLTEAEDCYRSALRADPNYAQAHNNLGIIFNTQGRYQEAEESFRRALKTQREFAGAQSNLGNALLNQGLFEEASNTYHDALALQPDLMEAQINLAILQGNPSRLASALPYYEKQLARNPNSFQINNRVGLALQAQNRLDEAQKHFEESVRLNPEFSEAHANLGNNYALQANLDAALASYRKVLALGSNGAAHQSYCFYLHNHAESDPAELFAEHLRWSKQYAEPLLKNIKPHRNNPDPKRRLKIGYVSSDFRQHSVAYFIEPVIRQHNRTEIEVYCYSNVTESDHVTERLQAAADVWRRISLKSNAQVVDMVQSDGIDILVDLTGHTSGSRLLMFAHKPAPVQVTYLGYPDTTGLSTIDYRLTDAFADPPGLTEQYHTEALLRLPQSFLLYAPPADATEVASAPSLKKGHITFGSFNNITKINRRVIALWSRLLLAVPRSRLLLKSNAFASASTKRRYADMFNRHGIDTERIDLFESIPAISGHLQLYGEIDIALDPFPYHGTTTTCEALWMGVPVVSLAGKTHVSRVGVSLLSNLGLEALIADSEESYLKIAAELANDAARLQQLRLSLRDKMRHSPLMDVAGFTGNLENAYRQMWQRWCDQKRTDA